MGWKVLIAAKALWTSGRQAEEELRSAGCELVRVEDAGKPSEARLIELLQGCRASFAAMEPYTARVFAACPDLALVSRCGIGIDAVDLPAATEAGVLVTNTPGAMTDAVADLTFAFLLAAARRIVEMHEAVRSGGWGEFPGVLVFGKTLGLVGFGRIGQAVARRAAGFDMKLLAYDPAASRPDAPRYEPNLPPVEFVTLEELLQRADFVSLHAPSLPETQGLFNAARFAAMKPSAYFINTARGSLVDEEALVRALETGQIAGAATDVFRQEPLPEDHPLRRAPNLLLSPHNGFNARECAAAMCLATARNITAILRGERPETVVNPAVWSSPRLRLPGALEKP
jgi:phosphoglycerate dehydrogenase-like enzyme